MAAHIPAMDLRGVDDAFDNFWTRAKAAGGFPGQIAARARRAERKAAKQAARHEARHRAGDGDSAWTVAAIRARSVAAP